jgi:PAP2 superfamily
MNRFFTLRLGVAVAALFSVAMARADAVVDWNLRCAQLVTEARLGTPAAIRLMAFVQTAADRAVGDAGTDGRRHAEAALASAHRTVLLRMLPMQSASIERAYEGALALVPDGPGKEAGVALGDRVAQALLAERLNDGAGAADTYRPLTRAGQYVPTAAVAIPQWPQRKPWLLQTAAQFRAGPPPALGGADWVKDYQEVQALGARAGSGRSAAQTDVARFWEYSLPAIYHGVVLSVAKQPGRDLARNARLFAVVAQAMDDAMIAVFEAKYHYHFWRPATAIRNGDQDGNDTTNRDPSWTPLIDAPMHPEYPSGHSILASTVATVLKAELGTQPVPELSTSSPTLNNATRRWRSLDDFVREVSDARIWGGIHFRSATNAGEAMGRAVGEFAARQLTARH